MKTGRGAIPFRLTVVLLFVTMPSLSSLPFVPRLDETAGDTSGRVCGFRDAIAVGMIGIEGANLVRFGRGMRNYYKIGSGICRCDYGSWASWVEVATSSRTLWFQPESRHSKCTNQKEVFCQDEDSCGNNEPLESEAVQFAGLF